MLLDALGVTRVQVAIGGSLGGMQVFEWAWYGPAYVRTIVPIAATARVRRREVLAVLARPDDLVRTAPRRRELTERELRGRCTIADSIRRGALAGVKRSAKPSTRIPAGKMAGASALPCGADMRSEVC